MLVVWLVAKGNILVVCQRFGATHCIFTLEDGGECVPPKRWPTVKMLHCVNRLGDKRLYYIVMKASNRNICKLVYFCKMQYWRLNERASLKMSARCRIHVIQFLNFCTT
jgi:hypothetical protein